MNHVLDAAAELFPDAESMEWRNGKLFVDGTEQQINNLRALRDRQEALSTIKNEQMFCKVELNNTDRLALREIEETGSVSSALKRYRKQLRAHYHACKECQTVEELSSLSRPEYSEGVLEKIWRVLNAPIGS